MCDVCVFDMLEFNSVRICMCDVCVWRAWIFTAHMFVRVTCFCDVLEFTTHVCMCDVLQCYSTRVCMCDVLECYSTRVCMCDVLEFYSTRVCMCDMFVWHAWNLKHMHLYVWRAWIFTAHVCMCDAFVWRVCVTLELLQHTRLFEWPSPELLMKSSPPCYRPYCHVSPMPLRLLYLPYCRFPPCGAVGYLLYCRLFSWLFFISHAVACNPHTAGCSLLLLIPHAVD